MTIPSTETMHTTGATTLPPAAKGLPVVGSLVDFLRSPFDFLHKAQARYGDIYTLNLGVVRWVILTHPRHTEQLFIQNTRNYIKVGGLWEPVRILLGNGLLVSEGDFWLRQRRMIQPHFHRQRLAALTDVMVAATTESLTRWQVAAQAGQSVELRPALSDMTMRILTGALFGQGLQENTVQKVSEAAAYISNFILVGSATASAPKWLPIPGAKRYQQMIDQLDEIVYAIIRQERAKINEQPSDSLLAMLVQMVDEESGEGMTDKQLRDEVMTFFLAGFETTSLALTWSVIYLLRNPAMLSKLQSEIDTVLEGRTPTFADLGALNYTRMVVQESTRIRPPAWWGPCTAVEDDEIDGYRIPAGTTVVNLTYGVHHNPGVWQDPERFDPERFTPEEIAQRHKLAWQPFGAGKRQCIGREFSFMEAQIILAMILQRYTLNVPKPPSTTLKFSATLLPKETVRVYPTPRAS